MKSAAAVRPWWLGCYYLRRCSLNYNVDRQENVLLYISQARVETADGKVHKIDMEGPADILFCDQHGNVSNLYIPKGFYAPGMVG